MRFSFICLIVIILFPASRVYATDSLRMQQACFRTAKVELEHMLDGSKPLSYERAIFLMENAYWENGLDAEAFNRQIAISVQQIKQIREGNRGRIKDDYKPGSLQRAMQTPEDRHAAYETLLSNWAIYSYMQDTLITYRQDHLLFVFAQQPFSYSFSDPLGTHSWQNTQVVHLLTTRQGNCFALASLYKIFADRLLTGCKPMQACALLPITFISVIKMKKADHLM